MLFVFAFSPIFAEQQIKIQTDETKNIQSGNCSMNINGRVLEGTIENGVCTLPNTRDVTTTDTTNPQVELVCELNSFNGGLCNKSLAEIFGADVPEGIKDATAITQTAGTTLLTATVLSPAVLGFASPSLFLSSLLLILGIRKKRPWGIVYDAKTKKPIPFATVELLKADTKEFVKQTVTDTEGRFGFIVDAGQYYLNVKMFGYKELEFKKDYLNSDVYQGEIINSQQNAVTLSVKVPVIADNNELSFFEKLNLYIKGNLPKFVRRLVLVVLLLSIIVAFFKTSLINLIVLLFYLILFYYLRYNYKKYSGSFGNVYELISKKGIELAFVKLIDKKSGSQVNDLVMTDKNGRFLLLADNGNYELNVETGSYAIKEVIGKGQITSPTSVDINYTNTAKYKIGVA